MVRIREISAGWVLSIVLGCAAAPPVFPPVDPPLVWPRTGAPPRIEYVGALSGEADLKRPRSAWSWLGDVLFGESPPATLESPYCLVRTPDNALYVSDPGSRTVHYFDLESREYRALTDAGAGRRFHTPIGVALRGDKVLVADRALRTVTVLSPDGEPEAVLGEGELAGPVGVAVGPVSKRVYVADVATHVVRVFESGGACVSTIGRRGSGEGEFNFPTFVACDTDENIYVSDSLNFRVQVFDAQGRFVRQWGQKGDAPGCFSQPKGLAVDPKGRVYVIDAHFENVQLFDTHGRLLLVLGEEGTDAGQFWLPIGIFVDTDGTIWIGDTFNRRVQVFRPVRQSAAGGAS